jgi:penicillin-binding protein 2
MKSISLKNHFKETRLFQGRALALLSLFLLCILLICARLIYLQLVEHKRYKTLSLQNVVDQRPIPPKRGLIYDRYGRLIANNIPSYSLTLIPDQIQDINTTIDHLKKIIQLSSTDLKAFHRQLKLHHRYEPVTLKLNLSSQEVSRFYVNRYLYPGVDIRATLMRQYPYGADTGHIIGYVGRINNDDLERLDPDNYAGTQVIGRTGIEKTFEETLHGKVGQETVEMDASGKVIRSLHTDTPVAGNDLYLSIDIALQHRIFKILGKRAGAVIVVAPYSGEILALVSNPSFDPNAFINGISYKAYQALMKAPQHPLIDRTVHGEFAAASTIKPFYAIAGLDSKTITAKTQIYDRGWFTIPNTKHVFHDWSAHGHGWTNVSKAIMESCDTFFYNLAYQLGLDRMANILHRFGFGEKTQIALPHEQSGLVPSDTWKRAVKGHPWYAGDTINAGIGQGYMLTTPIQLAMATASLATRGLRFKPQLVIQTKDTHGAAKPIASTPLSPIKLQHHWVWQTVINAMKAVIFDPRGTGLHFGRHPAYSAAGKTGTAQVYGHTRDEYNVRTNLPKRLRNNQLFTGFAPVEHPEIAIAVVIEHDGSASHIARQVMDAYFEEKKKHDTATAHAHNA